MEVVFELRHDGYQNQIKVNFAHAMPGGLLVGALFISQLCTTLQVRV